MMMWQRKIKIVYRWVPHMERMENDSLVKNAYRSEMEGGRSRGRSRISRKDKVWEYILRREDTVAGGRDEREHIEMEVLPWSPVVTLTWRQAVNRNNKAYHSFSLMQVSSFFQIQWCGWAEWDHNEFIIILAGSRGAGRTQSGPSVLVFGWLRF